MNRRLVPLTLAGAMAAVSLVAPGHALAVNAEQSVVVSANPADYTPQVEDGEVEAVAVVGNTVVIGGSFTSISDATESTPPVTRNFIAAFDATTGVLLSSFQPQLDGEVTSLAAGPGSTVFVGGAFHMVNGLAQQGLAELNVPSGARTAGFTGYVGKNISTSTSRVNALAYRAGRLYVGGRFTVVKGVARNGLAALDATGSVTSFNVQVSGSRSPMSAAAFVSTLDVTADGTTMVVGGNFLTVGGQPREQVAVVDLLAGAVTGWQTLRFHPASSFGPTNFTYVQQVSISPDGLYFVVVTTGGVTANTLCDAASRWELGPRTSGQQPTWVDYTGGDTLTSVAVAGAAVYVAGHPRWFNNFLGANSAGPGSVARQTIAALDPVSGLPLPWNPTMARPGGSTVEGPRALLATPDGLWVGWDADTVGPETHKRITFFPTTGGATPPAPNPTTLPGKLVIAGSDGSLKTRAISSDGLGYGPAAPVPTPGSVAWDQINGGFIAAGNIFYGTPDGQFHKAAFDGSTVGVPFQVLTPSWDLSTVKAMTYDNGRVYYTTGDGALHYRYFLASSAITGTQELTASTTFGVFPDTRQMFIGNGALYVSHAGGLWRIPMQGGMISGSAVQVSSDGSWTGTAAMLMSIPRPVLPPAAEHDFTGDGHGDVLGRDPSGVLWIYKGSGTGTFTSRLSLGSGWNAMTALITPGDFDGDGRADIITRDTAGRLWLYPGKAPATLGPRKQVGVGWQTMTAIVGVGDFNGDGLPDLVARDPSGVLWLYSGNGRDAFPHRTSLGPGWNAMNAITAAGPLTGQPGLLVRQASNGQLWFYPGTGHGGFAPRRSFGLGWNAMSALVGGVYLDADGNPDLLARQASTGQLWMYPGTAAGNIGPKRLAGIGWNFLTAIA